MLFALLTLCLAQEVPATAPSEPPPTEEALGTPEPTSAPERPAEPEPAESVPETPEQQLDRAKQLYFDGSVPEAKAILQALQVRHMTRDDLQWDTAAEAMIYLGEILYMNGEAERARDAFRMVLEVQDTYQLSPFSHPTEIAYEFNVVRKQVLAERAAVPDPVIPPAPAWTVLPLGIPQMVDGRPVRGALFGVGQLGLGVTSVAMMLHLRRINTTENPHPNGWSNDVMQRRVNTQRYAVQWPATIGTYALWGASFLEARSQWKLARETEIGIGWTPSPTAPAAIQVSGRF